jgi:hypothetical protein
MVGLAFDFQEMREVDEAVRRREARVRGLEEELRRWASGRRTPRRRTARTRAAARGRRQRRAGPAEARALPPASEEGGMIKSSQLLLLTHTRT